MAVKKYFLIGIFFVLVSIIVSAGNVEVQSGNLNLKTTDGDELRFSDGYFPESESGRDGLTVIGSGSTGTAITVQNTVGPYAGLQIVDRAGSGIAHVAWNDNDDAKRMEFASNKDFIFFSNDPGFSVGIGTTAPWAKLDVTGGILRIDTSSLSVEDSKDAIHLHAADGQDESYIILENTKKLGIWSNLDNKHAALLVDDVCIKEGTKCLSSINGSNNGVSYWSLQSGGTNIFNTLSDGNVGIGTTEPQAKLQVEGSGFFRGDTGALSASAGKGVRVLYATNYDAGMIFAYDYGADVAKNLIIPYGNVGIGMANPTTKLYVNGPSGTEGAISIDTDGQQQLEFLKNGVQQWAIGSDDGGEFGIYHFPTGAVRLWINNDGNVGIGTTSPTKKLHILGSALADDARVVIEAPGANNAGMAVKVNGVYRGAVFAPGGANDGFIVKTGDDTGPLRLQTAHADRVWITYNGNVGIGTVSPQSSAPNGVTSGNLDANDVYLRSTGKWASQVGTLTGYSVPVGGGQEVWLRGDPRLLPAKCTSWGLATCSSGAVVCNSELTKTFSSGPYHLDYGEGGSYGGNTYVCVKQY